MWADIKDNNQPLAELLKHMAEDQEIQDFIKAFDCTISVFAEDIFDDSSMPRLDK